MFKGAVAIHNQALSSSVYNGLGLLSYVSCTGTETNFTDCDHDVSYLGYCNYNFAAVFCQEGIHLKSFQMINSILCEIAYSKCFSLAHIASVPDNCAHGDIRLTGGSSKYEGTVEICVNNLWGTVCDSSWNTNDARVVCRQLGYLATGAVTNIIYLSYYRYHRISNYKQCFKLLLWSMLLLYMLKGNYSS